MIGFVAGTCSTAVGPDLAHLWQALLSGQDGRKKYAEYGEACLWPSTTDSVKQKIDMNLDRAYRDLEGVPSSDLGVILATTKGYVEEIVWQDRLAAQDPLSPVLHSFLERNELRVKKSLCVSNACSSFHGAVYLADMWMRRGDVRHVLVLAVDGVGPFVWKGFESLGLISRDHCRSFGADRSGLQLGEAAAAVLFSNTLPNVAQIEAVVLDAEGSPVARPTVSGRSLARACEGVAKNGRPDVILAHGTGTQFNDAIEDTAFASVFSHRPLITGAKWCVGHTLGASGAVDFLAATQMLRHQTVFPLHRTRTIDPKLKGCYVDAGQGVIQKDIERILVSSMGFGGVQSALMLRGAAVEG